MPTHYDQRPTVTIGDGHTVWQGGAAWEEVFRHARRRAGHPAPVVVLDAYPGTDVAGVIAYLGSAFPEVEVIDVERDAARPIEEIDALLARNLTGDRVFGVLSHHVLAELYLADALDDVARRVAGRSAPVLLVGWGAALVPVGADVVVLGEVSRWELQRRQRAGAPNWRCANHDDDRLVKYKRGFFVEWRIADRHKVGLLATADYLMDLNRPAEHAALISMAGFDAAMDAASSGPFRVVPYFDPGVWGGHWMKSVCGVDTEAERLAWCFDCVPEENSLLIEADGQVIELPAIDLVLTRPEELLGTRTHARFGPEFPIRFDMLDTMGGGNLSLQVHPSTGYIQDRFGMHYTQDESYYLLDAEPGAVVYLGLRPDTDPARLARALEEAQAGQAPFPAEDFVNTYPARRHDHFSIPAGTVHCSGRNSMVLEISATPYIFTFKLWDWGRLGLDGRPRPTHIEHGLNNIRWDRDDDWVRSNLVGRVTALSCGEFWTEERTGLHELEFIETRRHWFTGPVPHDTAGTVNVLNLVEGDEVVVESPTGAFDPFVVHYAETFIVPARAGAYVIRPSERSSRQVFATIKAFVRGTESPQAAGPAPQGTAWTHQGTARPLPPRASQDAHSMDGK